MGVGYDIAFLVVISILVCLAIECLRERRFKRMEKQLEKLEKTFLEIFPEEWYKIDVKE